MSFAAVPFGAAPFAAFGPDATASTVVPKPTVAVSPLVQNGDTARDSDGNVVDAPDPIEQEMRFHLQTVAGHFFGDPEIGNGVFRVRTRTRRSLVAIRDLVTRALQPMVDRGDIEGVTVTPAPITSGGTAINAYTVHYTKTGTVRR